MKSAASLVLGLLLAITGRAQESAQIVGTVTDPSGAVVPGVEVTISNSQKGYVRHLKTNSTGAYVAPALPIGDYVVTAEAPGFERLIRQDIHLQVGQDLRVDIALRLGQPTQSVSIVGGMPHVETETGALSHLVTGTEVAGMPLDGRNFTQLATLIPGAVYDNSYTPTTIGVAGSATISFNGNREQYNNWTIDGGNNQDEGSGSTALVTFPSIDSIAEFRVSTSNFGADLGRHAGAQIQVVTKSGTKEFHGDLYEYFRNDRLDANDWFLNRTIEPRGEKAPKQPLTWNDYGFTLGGPVFIPGHYNTDKSKTFFFWSEEWRAYRQGVVINSVVPTLLERQGDFRQCDPQSPVFNTVAASGCAIPTNPATGKPFPNDTVPIDPNAQALLDAYFPLPNNGIDGYTVAPKQATNWRGDQIRIDQNISDNTQVFFRLTNDAWNQVNIPAIWSGSTYDSANSFFREPAKSMVLSLTHTFRPNLLNEFIASWSEDRDYISGVAGSGSPAHSIEKPPSWTTKNIYPANSAVPFLPGVTVCGGVPFCANENISTYLPWQFKGPVRQFKDDLTWAIGTHIIKTGAHFEITQGAQNFGFAPQGQLSFNNSNPVTTGNALADMYLGRIATYQEGSYSPNGQAVGGLGYGFWRYYDFEPYVQDNWRATRKLSLNFGLRYYYLTPYSAVHNNQPPIDSCFIPSSYNPAQQAPLDANGDIVPNAATGQIYNYTRYGNGLFAAGTHGIPLGCMHLPKANFAPRFGFAFDPTGTGKTAIRGGYGMYYENGNGNETNAFAAMADYGNGPATLAPSAFNILGYANIAPGPLGVGSFAAVPLYSQLINVQNFSFTVEHSITNHDLLSVGYVGSLGRHLASGTNLNQVPDGVGTETVPALAGKNPYCNAAGACNVQQLLVNSVVPNVFFVPYQGYGQIVLKQNNATSSYNALQADFRHTLSHGLTLEAAYTWSHEIDDSTSAFFLGGGIDSSNPNRWRATGDINRTQALTINYVYEIPAFRNSSRPLLKQTLGGWKLTGISSFFTGLPTGFFNCGIQGLSSGIGQGVSCNSLGPVTIQKGVYNDPTFGPTPTWFNPNTVGQVTASQLYANGEPGMFGYMGRNVLTGPGRNNWDVGVFKEFRLPWYASEHSTLQFRFETFNTFNHPQWQTINQSCSSLTLPGQPCSGPNNIGNGEVASDWGPRIIQVALKLLF